MPRYTSGKGKVPPVPPLDMEEVKFWLQIMEEHALFIKISLPFDKPDLIEEATAFEREFKSLRVRTEKLISEKKFAELIADIVSSLKEFLRFKRLLLGLSLTNKLGSALPPLFFDHLIREAEYFMAILDKLRAGKKLSVVKAREADFWIRLMADHTKFIDGRLDPTERSLIGVVRGFETEFDDLTLQGRSYVSFFEHQAPDVPAFARFLQDSRSATIRLRDFKQATYDMICKNRMLTTMPALMADHIRREADHFLLVLAMMEKNVIKEEPLLQQNFTEDIGMVVDNEFFEEAGPMACNNWEEPKRESPIKVSFNNSGYSPGKIKKKLIFEQDASDDKGKAPVAETVETVGEKAVQTAVETTPVTAVEPVMEPVVVAPAVSEPVVKEAADFEAAIETKIIAAEKVELPVESPVIATDSKPAKYKWGGKWPRQLGKTK